MIMSIYKNYIFKLKQQILVVLDISCSYLFGIYKNLDIRYVMILLQILESFELFIESHLWQWTVIEGNIYKIWNGYICTKLEKAESNSIDLVTTLHHNCVAPKMLIERSILKNVRDNKLPPDIMTLTLKQNISTLI